jgi:hypothetical protein
MENTMQDVLTKLKSQRRLNLQLAFGLFFLILVGLYTFSHNANLMMQGTNMRFQVIGLIAAAVGELFMLYAFVVALFSAGGQRVAAVLSDVAMLAVLLFNTVVDYANVSGNMPTDGRWLFDLYTTYGAPILIVIVLVTGLHFILHLDHAVRFHSAEIAADIAEKEIETAAIYTAKDQMVKEMANPAHANRLHEVMQDKVVSIIDHIAKKRA